MTDNVPLRPFPIQFNKNTIKTILDIANSKDMDMSNSYLRIGVIGGGCAGLQYQLDIVDIVYDLDLIDEQYGIKLTVDPFSAPYLDGANIKADIDIFGNVGFRFESPNNIAKSCRCEAAY